MSPQDAQVLPPSSQAPADSLLSALDADFKSLWQQEIQDYVQAVTPMCTRPASLAPVAERRARRRPTRKASTIVSQSPRPALPVASLNLSALPLRLPRLRSSASTRVKAAALLTTAGLALTGAYNALQPAENTEPAPIQQMMYQNAESKVAAFRKEIEAGEYFVSDNQNQAILYESKPGDTIEKISKKYHVSPNTILQNNDRSKIDDVLEPGTRLTILPVDGIAHPVERHETLAELSKRYDVGIQEIIETNQLDNPHMITEKQKIIIPNATELKPRPTPEPKPLLQAIQASRTGRQAPAMKSKTGRRLSWPSQGVVTSNYGWRWLRMHNGMDIAGPIGTPIKAAKEGRVVYSGWMGGYGYAVDIDHGGGVRTRYAHCSSLNVRVGEYVHRGQTIGAMGSTGNSTGSHLHFEVHVGGQAIDPRAYF
ncbi:MAG: peptidoglycan DD-metalloendopeptidase family protein [Candidatus Sericytochromatia bacterium]|nr:peptidoglycan DD-metalloendopeptidase family protein [Candidatus Sericytochromatia bacterium]